MPTPQFAKRVARLPELLAFISGYADGVTLKELGHHFNETPARLREDLTVYLDLESWGWSFDIFRRSQVELVTEDDEVGDPATTRVRVVSDDPVGLGAEHLSAVDLAVVYQSGLALLASEPDNERLVGALEVISDTMYGQEPGAPRIPDWDRFLPVLRRATEDRRQVRLVYSRAWYAGVIVRVIEPLRLIQTQRGWELDAGPKAANGQLRTYLLANIRDLEVLDEKITPASDVDSLLEEQRRTSTVRVELVHDARWAADMYAERVTVVEDLEETFVADLELLPPVGGRVGLILLASGPASRVLQPGSVMPDAMSLVKELLEHHSQ